MLMLKMFRIKETFSLKDRDIHSKEYDHAPGDVQDHGDNQAKGLRWPCKRR